MTTLRESRVEDEAEAVAVKAERAHAARERREALRAAMTTWVDCVGCGRQFRGLGLTCTACSFKHEAWLVER